MALEMEADLPPGLACLKNVDTLLRCPICFDFLNITMMTKCCHNFCSLCIRKYFSYKLQCPVCNTQATEQDLRNNRLVDELVVNFQAARQQLSKATFDSPPISPKTPASAVKCKTPRQRGQKCNSSVLSQFFQKRPKTSPTEETQHDSSVAPCVRRGGIQTARTHNANDGDLHSEAAQLRVAVKEEPMDEEEASFHSLTSIKQEDTGSHSISRSFQMAHSSSQDVKPVIKGDSNRSSKLQIRTRLSASSGCCSSNVCLTYRNGKVSIQMECPVCSVSVPQQFINKHLDTCLTRGEKKESLRSSVGTSRRPMGKLVYNLLSLQELKRRLKECHLSVQGSRDQMIRRHRDFVQIYNAQCDSLNPKSAEEIAKELEANEKIRNQLQGKAKPVMVFSKTQSEKDIDEMHSNYRKQHSSDFSRLIAQVRGRLETSTQNRIKQEVIVVGEDEPGTHSADQDTESKSCPEMKVKDEESDEQRSGRRIELSPSPTYSDVSISSSISDIFGPEPAKNSEDTKGTTVQKRTSRSREDDASASPILGKRRRKK